MIVRYLSIIAVVIAALFAGPQAAEAKIHHYLFGTYDDGIYPAVKKVYHKKHRKHVKLVKHGKISKHVKLAKYVKAKHRIAKKKVAIKAKPKAPIVATVVDAKPAYQGRELVQFASKEKPGTIIINTKERSLYEVLGSGKAMRYLVAVGKEGFEWTGVARVGLKKVDPMWTPPPEMIERKPELAKWAMGIPGGDPQNPLGPRAMYLFKGKYDTGFRIHGTIYPESIGTAASSGCIRMLNQEVIELFQQTRVGTKVIVL
jgi:lipoprotein-anchoring transpeptidase ErfK/SrfK